MKINNRPKLYTEQIVVYITPLLKEKLTEVAKSFRMSKQWLYRDCLYRQLAERYGVIIDHDEELAAAIDLKEELKNTEPPNTEE